MTRDQLEHAIRAACDVSEDTELWIFGSQAILGEFPDAPKSLRASIEVDVQPKNRLERTDHVDGSLGELSIFHQTHGFYVRRRIVRFCIASKTKRGPGTCKPLPLFPFVGTGMFLKPFLCPALSQGGCFFDVLPTLHFFS
jgi:hypothetical protein